MAITKVTSSVLEDNVTVAGNLDVSSGTIKLDGNYPVGTENVALGNTALDSVTSGSYNTAIGSTAFTALTTGSQNTSLGYAAGQGCTGASSFNVAIGDETLLASGEKSYNTAVGSDALRSNTTASNNTALGYQSLYANTTGANNVAIGKGALDANTTANRNIAIGVDTLGGNTTGAENVGLGYNALRQNTTGNRNTSLGDATMDANTTGSDNTAVGQSALVSNTTANNNTAVGKSALYANTTGTANTAVGTSTLSSCTTGIQNTSVGYNAGGSLTTGSGNTFVGVSNNLTGECGSLVTTGSRNTIIGGYTGNQGGLDIRTSSNNIVLSDGDGNPRLHIDSNGMTGIGISAQGGVRLYVDAPDATHASVFTNTQANFAPIVVDNTAASGTRNFISFRINNTEVGKITSTGSSTTYATTSDYRAKENVVEMTGALARVNQLQPKRFNFISDADTTVDGFIAHEVQDIVPEAITGEKDAVDSEGNPEYQGIDQSKLVPLLTKAIQEQQTIIDDLKSRIETLEG